MEPAEQQLVDLPEIWQVHRIKLISNIPDEVVDGVDPAVQGMKVANGPKPELKRNPSSTAAPSEMTIALKTIQITIVDKKGND